MRILRFFCWSENNRFRDWFQYFLHMVVNGLSELIFLFHFLRMIKFKIPCKTEHLFTHKNPSLFIHASWMNITSELSLTKKKLWKAIKAYMPHLKICFRQTGTAEFYAWTAEWLSILIAKQISVQNTLFLPYLLSL